MKLRLVSIGLAAVLCGVLFLAGCARQAEVPEAEAPAEETLEAEGMPAPPEVDTAAVLAKADLADGSEDHVVGKCPSCALAMAGSAEHAVQFANYELQFCSQSCKDHFEESREKVILVLAELETPPSAMEERAN